MPKVEILALAPGLPRTDLRTGTAGDEPAARRLVEGLFPGRIGGALAPADLLTASYPEYGRVYAGTCGATALVCGQDLRELTDLGSAVAPVAGDRTTIRLQINGATESVGLEILGPGGLDVRDLVLVTDAGVVADEGDRLDFELPFWSGAHDPDGAYATVNGPEMPFDVIDFGQQALRTLFGFVVDSHTDREPGDIDARRVVLHGFVIAADPDDPADMAGVRSGGVVPDLPADPADLPQARPLRGGGRASDAGGSGGGGAAVAGAAAPTPSTGSWWRRLLDRMFG